MQKLYLTFINFLLNGPLELTLPYLISVTGSEAIAGSLVGVMSLGAFAGATSEIACLAAPEYNLTIRL